MAVLFILTILFVALGVAAYVNFRLGAARRRDGSRPRSLLGNSRRLGAACLVCGPCVGALSAFWEIRRHDVNPLDLTYTYQRSIGLGSLLGVLMGGAVVVAGFLASRREPAESAEA